MADNETHSTFSAGGRILLAAYLFLSIGLLAYLTAKLWPVVDTTTQTSANKSPSPAAGSRPAGITPASTGSMASSGSQSAPSGQQGGTASKAAGGAPSGGASPAPTGPQDGAGTKTADLVAASSAPSGPTGPQGETRALARKVELFEGMFSFFITVETRLILIVLVVGALGGCVHAATSFVAFAGKDDLRASWIWWYLLRAPLSGALALIAYFAVRGGFLSSGSTATVNDYGVAAWAGLVGMFTKQATAKLDEVFTTMFRTATPPASGAQPPNRIPALSAVDQTTIPHGSPDTTITLTGDGFVDKSEVRWSGTALTAKFVTATQLTATVPAAKLASTGSFDVTVFNPPPGGGNSAAVRVNVS